MERENWSTHSTADGREYYYNKTTKKSEWEKPDCLKSEEEKLNDTDWKEYYTKDGRAYYFNRKTRQSLWEKPQELKDLYDRINRQKDEYDDMINKLDYHAKVRNFKDLLRETGVTSTWKWDDANRIVQGDNRSKMIQSMSDRRSIFNEFVTEIRREEKDQIRQAKNKGRDQFWEMIREDRNINSRSKFYKIASNFNSDPRWKALEGKERLDLFEDIMDEMEREEEQELIEKSGSDRRYLRELLRQYPNRITYKTRWADLEQILHTDSRWRSIDPLDRLECFFSFWESQNHKYHENKNKERRTKERKNREGFREFLDERVLKGEFTRETTWGEFIRKFHHDSRYVNMVGQPGSTPKDLFDDKLHEVRKEFRHLFKKVSPAIKELNVKVETTTTFEQFDKRLSGGREYSQLRDGQKKELFSYLIKNAQEKEEDRKRKKEKGLSRFQDAMDSLRGLKLESKYEEFKDEINKYSSSIQSVEDETQRKLFHSYIDEYKDELKEEDSSGSESGAVKKSAKKKSKKSKKSKKKYDSSDSDGGKKKKSKKSRKRDYYSDEDDEEGSYSHSKKSSKHKRRKREYSSESDSDYDSDRS